MDFMTDIYYYKVCYICSHLNW